MDFLSEVPEWVILLAALITGIGVIWQRAIRPFAAMLKRIEASLTYVEREMNFNGGASMRDAIQRIDVQVRRLDSRLTQIEANTNRIEEEVTSDDVSGDS